MSKRSGDYIGDYKLTTDFTTLGGGMCRWAFARKGGVDYFIKEFLDPKFPLPDFPGSNARKEKMRTECQLFENHQLLLINKLKESVGVGGNIIGPIDFFRNESCYYKITEKVDVSSLGVNEIAKLPLEAKHLTILTISHSIKTLHRLKIVHGDLKPDNILIKDVGDKVVGKLIDMDNSYISGKPPLTGEGNTVVGDFVYFSPELADFINSSQKEENRHTLTTASDIFALGVIFHEFLTGGKPKFDEKYNYTWQAVQDGAEIMLECDNRYKELILSMLLLDHNQRPSADKIFELLKKILDTPHIDKSPDSERDKRGKLKINMGFKEDTKSAPSTGKIVKGKLKINM